MGGAQLIMDSTYANAAYCWSHTLHIVVNNCEWITQRYTYIMYIAVDANSY